MVLLELEMQELLEQGGQEIQELLELEILAEMEVVLDHRRRQAHRLAELEEPLEE